jgi:hypothetical protein
MELIKAESYPEFREMGTEDFENALKYLCSVF